MKRFHQRLAVGLAITLATAAGFIGCALSRPGNLASYYAEKYQGRLTANGERFDVARLTAAHRTLPFGTRVRVTNLKNGRTVVVRINDRGPYIAGRIIDLTPAAARQLDMIQAGVVPVKLEILSTASGGGAVASTE
ncbi:MAG TPA: septal ring lytic transglycosylase RlpA family protein [Tepidisphaeraceae bacterium]|jgi:rare lipoprotein A